MFGPFRRHLGRKPPLRSNRIGDVHSLDRNYNLTIEQHRYCMGLVERIQMLYDGAGAYASRNGLDPLLVFAGNEWADMIPSAGLRFRNTYNDVNFLRLSAPFAGYHLLILDRLDEPKFSREGMADFVAETSRAGIPDNIAQLVGGRIDPAQRLVPIVDEYINHIRNVPRRFIVRTPRLFGEIGIEVDGVLVNSDVILCQSRINALLCSGVLDKLDADIARRGRTRVVEVGPGYGALAYALRGIYGERLEYVAIDLPSSLYFSSIYLGILAGGEDCAVLLPGEVIPDRFNCLFVANYMADEVGPALGPIDLAINTMSFPEMSAAQVRHYGELFKALVGNNGVVFDENAAIKPHHVDSKAILSSIFPFRKGVSSSTVTTKEQCQDVWSMRYLGEIFDRGDAMAARR
jgi:hypothetical protein